MLPWDRGAQGGVVRAGECIEVVCVPVRSVFVAGGGIWPAVFWVWVHKGVGGYGGCHGGLVKVGEFDVVPGVKSFLEFDVTGVEFL